jgi:hypothetical protein
LSPSIPLYQQTWLRSLKPILKTTKSLLKYRLNSISLTFWESCQPIWRSS